MRALVERGQVWLTGHLLVLAIGGGAAAVVLLPILAGVVCAVVAITSVIFAIYSRRLMADERSKRRWAYVQGKRVQQRQLRAQAAIDNAILAICGDRQAQVSQQRNAELVQALRHLRGQLAQSAERPRPAGDAQPPPAVPAAPDLASVRQRLKQRMAHIEALEAEIQSLAVPVDDALREDAKELRKAEKELTAATREADRAARDRLRRGQTPTTPGGNQINFQLQVGPEGLRDIRQTELAPTPEEIAAHALTQRPPSR